MKVVQIRAIDGPNVYIHKPVLIMRLDLEEYTDRESYEFPGFAERLLKMCPGLYGHHCALGRPGGFVERLYGGTYFGHIIEHVCLELATLLGNQSNFGKTRNAGVPGLYDIIVEYQSEAVTRFLLIVAMELVQACALGGRFSLEERMGQARQIMNTTELGPSTRALMDAAKRRGIPVKRIGQGSLLQLGTGKYRKFVQATITQNTSAVAVDIASDKVLTKELLHTAGIHVPKGGVTNSLEEARRLFFELRGPVVVKPQDGCQGAGVSIDVRHIQGLETAFRLAQRVSKFVIVEEYVQGRQYRLLVVKERMVAASERIPAHVIGDGVQRIADLIEWVNGQPDRGVDHEKPLTRIAVDEVALEYLSRTGRSLQDVPQRGELVFLRDSANLSTGGIAIDVTHEVHPSYAALAARAAKAIGLDVCGVDVIAQDIRIPQTDANSVVIELNAAPGIRMHHYPSIGEPRDVAAAILDSLYPVGAKARVPIISVTGTNGKTTTTRMIQHILKDYGYTVGMTSTGGVYIGDEKVLGGDTTGPQSARLILSDSSVEAAVLETARGGIMRGGLAYDHADVGVVTNIAVDHLGQDGLETLEDILHVKSLVAECIAPNGGIAVLNADDPELVKLAGRLKCRVVFFSVEGGNAVISRHLATGGAAFFVREGWIVEAAGALQWQIVQVEELPITLHGAASFHVANALGAIAAARHLGVSRQRVARSLCQFRSDTHNPGRINLFRMPNGMHVIADYGHNPDGMRVVGEMAAKLSSRKVPAVIGFPGDRTDDLIKCGAKAATRYFGPLIIKEDGDTRGRQRGEVARLLVEAVREVSPETPIHVEYDECKALELALDLYPDEPLLLIFHEELEPIKTLLKACGGQEVHTLAACRQPSAIHAM